MIKIFNLFKKENKIENDTEDRTVYEIHSTFQTVLGEKVTYVSFYKLDSLVDGLISFKELELLDGTIHVEEITYNTDHIVSLESKVVGQRIVKKEVKNKAGYGWEYRRNFNENELE